MVTGHDVRLLGTFALAFNGVEIWLPPQAQRVVAFLALRSDAISRTGLAGNLWPSRSRERANAALRSAIWQMERRARGVIQCRGTRIALGPSTRTDLGQLNHAIATLEKDPGEVPCPSTFCADLLPDWDEDWLIFERERLRQRRLHALELLCETHTSSGRYGEAIEAGLMAIASEPLRESAHRMLIAAYLAEGNVYEARRQLERLAHLLHEELGITPSAELQQLVDRRCPRARG
jgi:DNA-binding SARP family transcriptional activator